MEFSRTYFYICELELLGERLICLNLYEIFFIKFLTFTREILENILLHLWVETLGERLSCLNLYEVLFIMFSARTITGEILEDMLLYLRAETLGVRLICLNLCEIFL